MVNVAPIASHRASPHNGAMVNVAPMSSAIRCSLVWMVPRFDALSIFPSTGSMPWRPLPSSGSLRVWFPGLVGTMRRSDFLSSIPGGLVDSPAGTVLALLASLPSSDSAPMTDQGFGLLAPLPAHPGRRKQDLPSSRRILSTHALLTSDPGGTGAPGHSAPPVLPSAPGTASAPTNS